MRLTAAQKSDIQLWFEGYRRVLMELGTKSRKNIINFDETGFRIGYMKGHDLLVPDDITEVGITYKSQHKILVAITNTNRSML